MPTYRTDNGAIVNVSEETAALMGLRANPADAEPAPARRGRARKGVPGNDKQER